MKKNLLLYLWLCSAGWVFSQTTNSFAIAMWNHQKALTLDPTNPSDYVRTQFNPAPNANIASSSQNVLKADGFNVNWYAMPGLGTTYAQYQDLLYLNANNTMKLADMNDNWLKVVPNNASPCVNPPANWPGLAVINSLPVHTGTNFYNQGNSYNAAVPAQAYQSIAFNYDDLYGQLLNQSDGSGGILSDHIFMHEIGTEMSYFHYSGTMVGNNPLNWGNYSGDCLWCNWTASPPAYTCVQNGANGNAAATPPIVGTPQQAFPIEVPPQNAADAMAHFKAYPNANKQMFAFGVASHNTFMGGQSDLGFYAGVWHSNSAPCPYKGLYYEKDYLWFPGVTPAVGANSTNKSDIIREASYYDSDGFITRWSASGDQKFDYLGKFKNIDKIHNNADVGWGYKRILSENLAAPPGSSPGSKQSLHSNRKRTNANWLRFLNYTSIIHGVDGLMFYEFGGMYDLGQEHADEDNAYYYMTTTSLPLSVDRFKRSNFPALYQSYVSKLAREIRYLVNNNLIAPYSVENTASANGYAVIKRYTNGANDPIVGNYMNYLPLNIPVADMTDLSDFPYALPTIQANFTTGLSGTNAVHQTADNALRYLITKNTAGEVIMIISNPNVFSLHNIHLDFTSLVSSVPAIAQAKMVDVLFDDGVNTNVNSYSYKTDTLASVSGDPFKLLKKYSIPFCNKNFLTDFGSFDTKVFYFNKNWTGLDAFNDATPNSTYNTGWQKAWTNNGDGTIGGWGAGSPNMSASDHYIPIDFNNDNVDELFCVQNINGGSSPAWAKVLSYNGTSWNTLWSNNNNGSLPGWAINANTQYLAGDFNGDGDNNELLLISGGCAVIYQFNNGNWTWWWYNFCNNKLNNATGTFWPLSATSKYVVGDFNGDNRNNDILAVDASTNSWALITFNMSQNNFVNFGGSASGYLMDVNTITNSIWKIGANDQYLAGDYNGDGKKDEVMCIERGQGYSVAILKANPVSYPTLPTTGVMEWQTVTGSIANWGAPILSSDLIMSANLDTDLKTEMMFISAGGYATSEDLNASNTAPQWNWSNHNQPLKLPQSANYIGDWRISDPSAVSSSYFFMKPVSGGTTYLVAMKSNSCNQFLVSMYKTDAPTGNNYRATSPQQTDNLEMSSQLAPISSTGTKIQPNPNSGSFTLITGTKALKTIQVYDMLGHKIYEDRSDEDQITIQLGEVTKGVYQVRVTEGLNVVVKKLIVE